MESVLTTTNVVSSNPTQARCIQLAADQWFSPGTPVSSTNKTDRYNIAEILLKVALNTITLTLNLHDFLDVLKTNFFCSLEMTLKLTPTKLSLNAAVTLDINLFTKELYKNQLWYYTTPTIQKKVINEHNVEIDSSPPQISSFVGQQVIFLLV
jgi:tRNA U34 5-methylaminomethyl-2-thiouridine-forming methyltransferase MnmC